MLHRQFGQDRRRGRRSGIVKESGSFQPGRWRTQGRAVSSLSAGGFSLRAGLGVRSAWLVRWPGSLALRFLEHCGVRCRAAPCLLWLRPPRRDRDFFTCRHGFGDGLLGLGDRRAISCCGIAVARRPEKGFYYPIGRELVPQVPGNRVGVATATRRSSGGAPQFHAPPLLSFVQMRGAASSRLGLRS